MERTCGAGVPLVKTTLSVAVVGYFTCLLTTCTGCFMLVTDGEPVCVCFLLVKNRPWNKHNTKDRRQGDYYDDMWQHAYELVGDGSVKYVSITSYNEWGEGTQIESSRCGGVATSTTATEEDGEVERKVYLEYPSPYYYMNRTNVWVDRWATRYLERTKQTRLVEEL